MNLTVGSMPVINSEKGREKLKTVGAPAVLAGGAAFIASKAPKDAADKVKLSKRFAKTGKAALITAAIMALLTTNKEEVTAVVNNAKDLFSKITKKEELPQCWKVENFPEVAPKMITESSISPVSENEVGQAQSEDINNLKPVVPSLEALQTTQGTVMQCEADNGSEENAGCEEIREPNGLENYINQLNNSDNKEEELSKADNAANPFSLISSN